MDRVLAILGAHKEQLDSIRSEADASATKLDNIKTQLAGLDKSFAVLATELRRLDPLLESRVNTAEEKAEKAHSLAWKSSAVIGALIAGGSATAHTCGQHYLEAR